MGIYLAHVYLIRINFQPLHFSRNTTFSSSWGWTHSILLKGPAHLKRYKSYKIMWSLIAIKSNSHNKFSIKALPVQSACFLYLVVKLQWPHSFLSLNSFHFPATSANLLVNSHRFPKSVFPGDYTQENVVFEMWTEAFWGQLAAIIQQLEPSKSLKEKSHC